MNAMVTFERKKIILSSLGTRPKYRVPMFRSIEDIQPSEDNPPLLQQEIGFEFYSSANL